MKNKAAYDSSLHGRGGYQTGLNIVWEQPDRKWFSNADRSLVYICKYSMSSNYIQSAHQLWRSKFLRLGIKRILSLNPLEGRLDDQLERNFLAFGL